MSYKTVREITSEFPILLIGKSGNGKSSLGNALLGEKKFAEGRGMSSTTTTAEYAYANRNRFIKVIDTPDVTNIGLNEDEQHEEVAKWRNMVATRPAAVLLVISCEVRYTPEEFAIYKKILKLWGNDSLKARLVVVFTFGDRLDGTIQNQIAGSSEEMKEVLKDAEQAYFVCNKKDEQSRSQALDQVVKVLNERGGKKQSPPPQRTVRNSGSYFQPIPAYPQLLPEPSYQFGADQPRTPKDVEGLLSPSKSSVPVWLVVVLLGLALIAVIACVVLFVMNILIPAIICVVVAVVLAVIIGGICYTRRKSDHCCMP